MAALSVIDTATNTVTATVMIGGTPGAIAITPNGAFAYVPSYEANTVMVIDTATNTVTATVPSGNGPSGVAITPNGAFAYVTNVASGDVSVIDTATNTVIATVAVGASPVGISITPNGAFVYVANYGSGNVSVINTATNTLTKTVPVGVSPLMIANTPLVIETYAGNGTQGFSGDEGPATDASLNRPFGVAADTVGNVYIADTYGHRIRKVNSAGVITTVAGNGTPGFGGDGGAATSASLDYPTGIAVDTAGDLYIADSYNGRIRRVDTATGAISTVAGGGSGATLGDDGPATSASLYLPAGVAVD